MTRITEKDLQKVVDRINRETGSPMTTYTKTADGKHSANVGNYHLDGAYGGWKLVRMDNQSGGIRNVTDGFVPKRELYDLMHAILTGMELTHLGNQASVKRKKINES